MKLSIVLVALALTVGVSPAIAQTTPPAPPTPEVVIPEGELPVGEAQNLVFLAPVIGGLLAVGALGGGGSTPSTPSTPSTN